MRRVRVNREDPRRGAGPFANLVTGVATVIVPNGTAYSSEGERERDATGAYSGLSSDVPKEPWSGNRSGE